MTGTPGSVPTVRVGITPAAAADCAASWNGTAR